jgi:spermidine synthase
MMSEKRENREGAGRLIIGVVLGCFFLSGISGLIYEVVWTRMLILIFGSTTFAVSTILTAYMGGLALGSFLAGQYIDRSANPLRVYGLLEIGIGLYGLAIAWIFSGLVPVYKVFWGSFHPSFYAFSLVRFILIFIVLVIPTTLMGATLPVLSKFYAREQGKVGLRVGLLYALNTVGAVVGSFGAGFFLLPGVGVHNTTLIAVAVNILLGVAVLGMARVKGDKGEGRERSGGERHFPLTDLPTSRAKGILVLAAFGVSGFAAMVYEVAWSRVLSLIIGSSVYGFCIMLTTFLVGLALGSFICARLVDRLSRRILAFSILQVMIALSAFSALYLFRELPYLFFVMFYKIAHSQNLLFFTKFLLAFAVMFIPTLLMGAVFPLVIKIYTTEVSKVGRFVGEAYSINTLGAVLGSFSGGFIMIPLLGIQGSLLFAIALNLLLAAVFIPLIEVRRKLGKVSYAPALAILFAFVFLFTPPWDPNLMSSGMPVYVSTFPENLSRERFFEVLSSEKVKTLFYREGLDTTVIVNKEEDDIYLRVNGKTDASNSRDMETQILSGHYPMLFSKGLDDVLVIGIGSGVTVGSIERYPVKRVICVEIESSVVEATRFFNEVNNRPLEDRRTQVFINDGRNYLMVTPDKFDVIVSEPSNPWITGCSNLFTREYFEIAAQRLKRGGVMGQWIQLYSLTAEDLKSLIKTFHSVFPEVLVFYGVIPADLILLGSQERFEMDVDGFRVRLNQGEVREDLERIGVRSIEALLGRFVMGTKGVERFTQGAVENTDDNALIEFSAPKHMFVKNIRFDFDDYYPASKGISDYLVDYGDSEEERREFLEKILAILTLIRERTIYAEENYQNAIKYLRAKEYDKAALELERAVNLNPEFSEAHLRLGIIYNRIGKRDEAIFRFRRALEINPRYAAAHSNLGSIYYFKGILEEAAKELEEALKIDPYLAEAHNSLGGVYFKKGMIELARSEVQKALDINPGYAEAHKNLGLIYLRQGLISAAVKEFKQFIAINDSSAFVRAMLGNIYFGRGELREAEKELLRALEIDPRYPKAYFYLASVYEKVDQERAIQQWRRYLEVARDQPSEAMIIPLVEKRLKQLE